MYDSLIQSESGGNWQAQNREMGAGGQAGHYGRLQFGHARLQDAMNAGVLPRGTTPQQFMANPDLQMAVEQWHFSDIDRQAQRMGLDRYIGQQVGGVTITPEAIRAMAHLGGIGGAARFLESGGAYNPSDSFGTSLLDYAQQHGGAGQRPSPRHMGNPSAVNPPTGNALAMQPQGMPAPQNALAAPPPPPQLQFDAGLMDPSAFMRRPSGNALQTYGFAPGQSPFIPG